MQINDAYDAMGDLTTQSGSGATAATATRSFTYDAAGRVADRRDQRRRNPGQPRLPARHLRDRSATTTAACCCRRPGRPGLVLHLQRQPGSSTSATDAAGTSTYTYDSAGRLATDADAASGTTGTYSYNNLDQVTWISYGTGNDTQSFGYDDLHRLTSDTLDRLRRAPQSPRSATATTPTTTSPR